MEVLKLTESNESDVVTRARSVLKDGGIVAFPTETVYGLATRGDDEAAVDRLFRAKRRPADRLLAHYVVRPDDVRRVFGPVRRDAEKLMRALWPGPLTLVLEKEDGETVGFRCSSHPFVPGMVGTEPYPVVGTSANLSGDEPITNAAAIESAFRDRIDLVVDAGVELGNRASTVVLLPRGGGFRLLRTGEIGEDVIAAELAPRFLFVCTGNTCRSPLAQVFFERRLREEWTEGPGQTPRAYSAGTGAVDGLPASENSRAVAAERGLDLGSHRSKQLTPDLVQRMDRVITMTRAQEELLRSHFPDLAERITCLTGEGPDVSDPFGGRLETYRRCADQIEAAVKEMSLSHEDRPR